jgi:hypothetical protein
MHAPVNINVSATGGSAAQNADLARQIGDHVDRVMRQKVIEELRIQARRAASLRRANAITLAAFPFHRNGSQAF